MRALLLVLAVSAVATAQEPWTKTISHIGDGRYEAEAASFERAEKQFVASCALDLGSTALGLWRGYTESSPLAFGSRNKAIALGGVALTDLILWRATRRMHASGDDRLATSLLRFASVVRVGAASWNVTMVTR